MTNAPNSIIISNNALDDSIGIVSVRREAKEKWLKNYAKSGKANTQFVEEVIKEINELQQVENNLTGFPYGAHMYALAKIIQAIMMKDDQLDGVLIKFRLRGGSGNNIGHIDFPHPETLNS